MAIPRNPITPTVGRKVWYYAPGSGSNGEPMDATIVRVWGNTPDALVNLHVNDPNSQVVWFFSSVQWGDEDSTQPHYRWMPYQMGQAAANKDAP